METVGTGELVKIYSGLPELDVNISKSATVEVSPDQYMIASTGYSGGVPGWVGSYISSLVQSSIGTGGTLADALNTIRTDLMGEITLGVNQVVSMVQNDYVSNSTLATTLASEIAESNASVLNAAQTYADSTFATATTVNALKASLGDTGLPGSIEAFIGNIALTKVDAEGAWAGTTNTLVAMFNDQSARIDSVEFVEVGLDGYLLGAAKLATAPDGSITGWEFLDGTNIQSQFKVNAQKFSVSDGTTGYTPFTVDSTAGKIYMNAAVEFKNLGINGGSTSIDGGKIATNSLSADRITANTIWADGIIQSTNYNWNNGLPIGFGLFPTGDTVSGQAYNVVGSKIYGAQISGTTLISSTISARELKVITDAGYETKSVIYQPAILSEGTATINIYGDLYTQTTLSRIAAPSSLVSFVGVHEFSSVEIDGLQVIGYQGYILLYHVSAAGDTSSITVTVNGVSGSLEAGNTTATVNSIEFARVYVDKTYQYSYSLTGVFVRPVNTGVIFNNQPLTITLSRTITKGFGCTVYNV